VRLDGFPDALFPVAAVHRQGQLPVVAFPSATVSWGASAVAHPGETVGADPFPPAPVAVGAGKLAALARLDLQSAGALHLRVRAELCTLGAVPFAA
jgi:hypothetical protein